MSDSGVTWTITDLITTFGIPSFVSLIFTIGICLHAVHLDRVAWIPIILGGFTNILLCGAFWIFLVAFYGQPDASLILIPIPFTLIALIFAILNQFFSASREARS
jgi:hypothetical protein